MCFRAILMYQICSVIVSSDGTKLCSYCVSKCQLFTVYHVTLLSQVVIHNCKLSQKFWPLAGPRKYGLQCTCLSELHSQSSTGLLSSKASCILELSPPETMKSLVNDKSHDAQGLPLLAGKGFHCQYLCEQSVR